MWHEAEDVVAFSETSRGTIRVLMPIQLAEPYDDEGDLDYTLADDSDDEEEYAEDDEDAGADTLDDAEDGEDEPEIDASRNVDEQDDPYASMTADDALHAAMQARARRKGQELSEITRASGRGDRAAAQLLSDLMDGAAQDVNYSVRRVAEVERGRRASSYAAEVAQRRRAGQR